MSEPTCRLANLDDPADAALVLALTQGYAADPLGQGAPLDPEVAARLIPALRALPTTVIVLCELDGQAAAHATCFLGFSTFAAAPLLNIHDFCVQPAWRGRGLARVLLAGVEAEARARGCVKVSLECHVGNARALGVYWAAGFRPSGEATSLGGALFMTKPLAD